MTEVLVARKPTYYMSDTHLGVAQSSTRCISCKDERFEINVKPMEQDRYVMLFIRVYERKCWQGVCYVVWMGWRWKYPPIESRHTRLEKLTHATHLINSEGDQA